MLTLNNFMLGCYLIKLKIFSFVIYRARLEIECGEQDTWELPSYAMSWLHQNTKVVNSDHITLTEGVNVFYRSVKNWASYGQWLWHSWQHGRFRYQRTRVRIQSWATFSEHILLLAVCRKDEKRKRGRKWPILKKSGLVYLFSSFL